MAEEHHPHHLEKKPEEEVLVTDFEKIQVSEPVPKYEEPQEEKKPDLLEKLSRSGSRSSSSSDEEEGKEGEKKKKKKKGLKENILGEKKEDTSVPIEKYEGPAPVEEKKGFLDKIKEKLPGQSKKPEEVPPPSPPAVVEVSPPAEEGEVKEKKGFLDKIKGKLPGYHPKTEEDKEKEKASA